MSEIGGLKAIIRKGHPELSGEAVAFLAEIVAEDSEALDAHKHPGKFEGAPSYGSYFHNVYLNGGSDEDYYPQDLIDSIEKEIKAGHQRQMTSVRDRFIREVEDAKNEVAQFEGDDDFKQQWREARARLAELRRDVKADRADLRQQLKRDLEDYEMPQGSLVSKFNVTDVMREIWPDLQDVQTVIFRESSDGFWEEVDSEPRRDPDPDLDGDEAGPGF